MAAPVELRHDQLLQAARVGDDRAFRFLVERYRRGLYDHCRRMLGSPHDAGDALQDALLRIWRGLPGFDGRGPLRPWLYRIATNACLDSIRKGQARAQPTDESDEFAAIDDRGASPVARSEQREALELALVAALQHLPPRQRAALILSDVLGFSARETAAVLDTTPTAVNSALQRARKVIDDRLPDGSEHAALRTRRDARLTAIVERYARAVEQADVGLLVSMLSDDAERITPSARRRRARAPHAAGRPRTAPSRPSPESVSTPARAGPRARPA